MSRIANYVAGPYSGVSQAPPQLRLPDACEDMQDCLATIPHGIQKRPPFKFISKLLNASSALIVLGPQPLYQEIPRGSPSTDVDLLINYEGGQIVVHLCYAATGVPIPLTVTSAASTYLNKNSPTTPNQQFRCCSIEDYTFITNRTVTVAESSATAPTRPPEFLIWCKTGQYGRTYSVSVTLTSGPNSGTTVSASYTCPQGGSSADANFVGTDIIIAALYSGIKPSGATDTVEVSGALSVLVSTYGFNYDLIGSTLYFVSSAGYTFTVTTSDAQGDTAMYAISTAVQDFSDLPLVGHNTQVVEVLQSAAGGNSDFYVQYQANNSTQGPNGAWVECLAPGSALGLDPTTMPIALTVNETTGAWTLDAAPFTQRTTGNPTLSPDPQFVGDQITDVKWWAGRLALVSNGGVTLSASDSPFKFYTTTLAAALDSDPIGLLTPAARKTFFKQALIFDQRFFAFGDRVQAAITSGSAATTPSTTIIQQMAQSSFSDQAIVQSGNHKVRYLAMRTTSAIVYMLAIDRLSGLALEEEQTTAVPQYIPNTIDCAATWETDYFTIYGTTRSAAMFVNVYREKDYQQVQNAFYRWNCPIGFTLGGMYFKAGILYTILQDASYNAYKVTLDTTPLLVTQGRDANLSTVPQYLDFMVDETLCTVVYTASSNTTTYTLPFGFSPTMASLRTTFNGYPEGYRLTNTAVASGTITVKGNWTGANVWIGIAYNSFFIPSEWFVVGADKKPMHDGRLSMKRLKCDVAAWGYLAAAVNLVGRAQRTFTFEGLILDYSPTPLNAAPNEETTTLMVPLAGLAHDISVKFYSAANLGFKFLGYEWIADWNPRSRRVT